MRPTTRRALLAGALGMGVLTTMSDEPLVDLFRPTAPTQAQNMTYRQGTVVAWDSNTLQNTVIVGGNTFTDLPVLGVGEAQTIRPGSVVGIHCVRGEGGETWAIIGRLVNPNTPAATEAVSLLNSLIYSDQISSLPSGEGTSSTTYVDLATVGPQVTVPVGPTGRILIIATAQMQWGTGVTAHQAGGGLFNVAFSGANTRTPNDNVDQLVGVYTNDISVSAGTIGFANIISVTTQAIFDTLNPGATTVKMMYRKSAAATTDPNFFRRTLTVVRL